METYKDKKLSQIVTENLKAAELLEENHIDFCCGGDKTLVEACRERNVSPDVIEKQLDEIMQGRDSETEFINNLDAAELSDYITKRHHAYVRENIPALKKYLNKIAQVHGARHPELLDVRDSFHEASDALSGHLEDEEKILFPHIRQMVQAKKEGITMDAPDFETVEKPIRQMLEEHENEGERFDWLSEKTNDFKVPEDGCNTYRITYNHLKEFKKDLHKHIHLENNILFPEAKRLEQEVIKK